MMVQDFDRYFEKAWVGQWQGADEHLVALLWHYKIDWHRLEDHGVAVSPDDLILLPDDEGAR